MLEGRLTLNKNPSPVFFSPLLIKKTKTTKQTKKPCFSPFFLLILGHRPGFPNMKVIYYKPGAGGRKQ